MIPLNLNFTIAAFLIFTLVVVFMRDLLYTWNRDLFSKKDGGRHIRQCAYCTFIFEEYQRQQTRVSTCPRCHSYLNPEERHEKTLSPRV